MATSKRYIPPGARNKETAGAVAKNTDQDSHRTLDHLNQVVGSAVFIVKLRSKQTYSKFHPLQSNFIVSVVF